MSKTFSKQIQSSTSTHTNVTVLKADEIERIIEGIRLRPKTRRFVMKLIDEMEFAESQEIAIAASAVVNALLIEKARIKLIKKEADLIKEGLHDTFLDWVATQSNELIRTFGFAFIALNLHYVQSAYSWFLSNLPLETGITSVSVAGIYLTITSVKRKGGKETQGKGSADQEG